MCKIRILRLVCCVILISVVSLTVLFVSYKGKNVHLSFDDVELCFKDLNDNCDIYPSIFEQPFLRELKFLHEHTGAKFTLYIYEDSTSFYIQNLRNSYITEFNNNSTWLKIGFHAQNSSIVKDSISNYNNFVMSYSNVYKILHSKFNDDVFTHTLRLHYFYATQEELSFIKSKGIRCLLSADDERISYSLSKRENEKLIAEEFYITNGIKFIATDVRVERDNVINSLLENATDDELVVFTHEWAFKNRTKYKFYILTFILSYLNCHFIN